MKQMGEKRILDYRVDIRGRIRVVSGSHGSFFFFEPAGSALLTFLSSSTSRNSFSLGCSERESMAARNLVPCVTIRRAESTGEDPIYTCATDEDTASRPAPRWERSTAPPPRWPWRRPGGAGVSPCGPSARSGRGRKSGGGRAGRSRGRGEPIGGAEIGKRRGPPCANIFSPPAGPWSMLAGPHARKPPGGHAPRPLHVPHGPARPAT